MKKLITMVVLIVLVTTGLHAQNATVAGGGEANGSGGTASFTLGQVACQTFSGTGGTVSEGVQQAFEIYVLTGLETTTIQLKVSAYPNPVSDFLMLEFDNSKALDTEHRLSLHDVSGKLLYQSPVSSLQTRIPMRNYISGIYFLRVNGKTSGNNAIVKTFKIIKN